MIDSMNLALQFFINIINLIPGSPLMWLFGLCIIFTIFMLLVDVIRQRL